MTIAATRNEPATNYSIHAEIPDIVGTLGSERFGATLMRFLRGLCGADHYAAFRIDHGDLHLVTATSADTGQSGESYARLYASGWWRRDPAISQIQGQGGFVEGNPSVIRLDVKHLPDTALRQRVYPHVSDRLLAFGHANNVTCGLSVLRSEAHPEFSDSEMTCLANSAHLIVALLAKHADVISARPSAATALTALKEIENCLVETTDLPRRELEVCSRILYGMSSCGMSLDLNVSEETVKTYRKRAYQRLHIGCERELLVWYLSLWSAWRGLCARIEKPDYQGSEH